jgi:hypothetical protein
VEKHLLKIKQKQCLFGEKNIKCLIIIKERSSVLFMILKIENLL